MDKKLDELKKEYNQIPVPAELDFVVRQALKKNRGISVMKKTAIGAAAAALLFVGCVNASPALARSMEQLPVLGQVVKVVSFTSYKVEDGGNSAHIEVPSLEDMNNTELQASLNEKYAAESKALYEQFLTETKLQDVKGGHFSIDSGYEIKTNNEQILSLARYVVETAGSSAESYHIDTIDKQNEWLITLPSLFKHDDYIAVISDNIKQQMISRMEQDESLIYWIEQADDEAMTDAFQHISADQTFYINDQQQLVIVFNEYEVAPGYMGIVEFTIPSEVLADVLVSDAYIK